MGHYLIHSTPDGPHLSLLGSRDPAAAAEEVVRSQSVAVTRNALFLMAAAPGVAVIVHSNAADRGNGLGAQEVELEGVDADGNLNVRRVVLSSVAGTTTDTGGTRWWHIHRMRVTRYGGSNAFNTGDIAVNPEGVTHTFGMCGIDPTVGVSRQCVFFVPDNKYAIIKKAFLASDGTNAESFVIWSRRFSPRRGNLAADGNGNATLAAGICVREHTHVVTTASQVWDGNIVIPPKSLVLVTRNGLAGAGELHARLEVTYKVANRES